MKTQEVIHEIIQGSEYLLERSEYTYTAQSLFWVCLELLRVPFMSIFLLFFLKKVLLSEAWEQLAPS